MKPDLRFQFSGDMTTGVLTVRRDFAARRDVVWDCHTKSELLDKWFAPKPLSTMTKSMEFREGGHWHYAMIDEDGTHYWGRTDYKTITPTTGYTTTDAFTDETGAPNEEMPISQWSTRFSDEGAGTRVENVIDYGSPEALQTVIDMGMEEGIASTFEKLDETLAALTK
ncbi:SRPBCC domain-containing protein [Maritimibacter sp. DP1N21-5]|uniref:SRPBCC family protein n=1 Tax=Maritimibacter sp. DP1N21-5 TaxID=2836867 RepID=UPI001C43DBEC|nr:SRPBCC domain-containing protein [Maritimibacter sp. DP1N21-5]MBV7408109.1 SRPBCC domain-containing protein [Maritimibacter sp. DP1N21-5]